MSRPKETVTQIWECPKCGTRQEMVIPAESVSHGCPVLFGKPQTFRKVEG